MPNVRPRSPVGPVAAVARATVVVAALVALAVIGTGCGHHGDGLAKGHIDLGITTTSGGSACDQVTAIETAITEASLTATRADDAVKAQVRQQIAALTASVPATLQPDVAVLGKAFDTLWSNGGTADPFDTTAYATADQAIRRYIQSGCTAPTG